MQLGDPVEVLLGGRVEVGRAGQLGQVVAVAHRRQSGGHRREGQGEPQQGLVEGLVAVPLQEPQPLPPGRVQARGQRVAGDQAGPGVGGQRGQVAAWRLLGQFLYGLDGRNPPLL